MFKRFTASLGLVLLGLYASTGSALAADYSDRTKVMVGTGLVVLGFLAVLFIAYVLKRALGLVRMPVDEPQASTHGVPPYIEHH